MISNSTISSKATPMRHVFLCFFSTLFSVAALGAADVTVEAAWSRATAPSAQAGVAFLMVANAGDEADTLQSVSSPVADRAELHAMTKDAAGVLRMTAVEGGIVVPAHGKVELKPGGYHVMLFGLTGPLVEKGSFALTLQFARAGAVAVTVVVAEIAATGAPACCVSK